MVDSVKEQTRTAEVETKTAASAEASPEYAIAQDQYDFSNPGNRQDLLSQARDQFNIAINQSFSDILPAFALDDQAGGITNDSGRLRSGQVADTLNVNEPGLTDLTLVDGSNQAVDASRAGDAAVVVPRAGDETEEGSPVEPYNFGNPNPPKWEIKRDVEPSEVTVEKGDSLWRIARRSLGPDASENEVWRQVEEMKRLNGLTGENPIIHPGDKLKVPGHTADGGLITTDADGNRTITHKDGTVRIENKDGTTHQKNPDGSEKHTGPNPDDNYEVTPDGQVVRQPDPGTDDVDPDQDNPDPGSDNPDPGTDDVDPGQDQPNPNTDNPSGQPIDQAVDAIHRATDGSANDRDAVVAALEGRTEAEMRELKAQYKAKYGVNLEDHLRGEFPDAADRQRLDQLLNPRDQVDLATERQNLDDAARRNLSPSEYAEFQRNMQELEARKQRDGLSDEEVARTYREVSRMLNETGSDPLDQQTRENLARQVMEQAAKPTTIDQGEFRTCNVTTVETRTYTRNPSEAARMVADMAIDGRYVSRDGRHVVEGDPSAKTDQARNYPPNPDGQRSHASEIFQVTATNLAHKVQGRDYYRYEQLDQGPLQGTGDNGERLWDTRTNPPTEVARSPYLDDSEIADVSNAITGENRTDHYLVGVNDQGAVGDNRRVTIIDSQQELEQTIADAKRDGRLPLIVRVNTVAEPFWSDSGGGAAGGSGGAHVVTITDYQPGPPPKVSVDNQWGTSADHTTSQRQMEISQLYRAMQPTADVARALEQEVIADRNAGRLDVNKETDLLRVKKSAGLLTDGEYKTQLDDLYRRTKEEMDRQSTNMSAQEREEIAKRLSDSARGLPPKDSTAFLARQLSDGMISKSDHDFQVALVGWRLATDKRNAEGKGTFTDTMRREYERNTQDFRNYLDTLPEQQQREILDKIKRWTGS